jgi:UDP-N-acetylglucosamine--N-acetylmuramyl-(pentapeptide) pyrophosphoryl-undecaprenol N-acetylglucosamine transferase
VKLAHATPVGIPLRPAIADLDRAALRDEARARFGLEPDGPVLMVTGGSQGAQAINRAVAGAAQELRRAGVQVLHIVGPQNTVDVPPGSPPYVVVPFVEQMQYAYAAADLVVCRSGAMTCAELSAVGLPAVYVPLPLRGGEQRLNAEPIAAAGGAVIVDNDDFTSGWVKENLLPMISDPATVATMASAAARTGARDADVVLARHVLRIVADARPAAS